MLRAPASTRKCRRCPAWRPAAPAPRDRDRSRGCGGHSGARFPPTAVGLGKQPPGIERHHVDVEIAFADPVEDELALDAEAVREDDGPVDRAAQIDEALGRRQRRQIFAANSGSRIKHAALNVRRSDASQTGNRIRLFSLAARNRCYRATRLTAMPCQIWRDIYRQKLHRRARAMTAIVMPRAAIVKGYCPRERYFSSPARLARQQSAARPAAGGIFLSAAHSIAAPVSMRTG